MDDITFQCPYCGQHLSAPTEMRGTTVECPTCSQAITIPASPPSMAARESLPLNSPPPLAEQQPSSQQQTPGRMVVDMSKLRAMAEERRKNNQKARKRNTIRKTTVFCMATLAIVAAIAAMGVRQKLKGHLIPAQDILSAIDPPRKYSTHENDSCLQKPKGHLILAQDILSAIDPQRKYSTIENDSCFRVGDKMMLSDEPFEIPMTVQSSRISFEIQTSEADYTKYRSMILIHTLEDAGLVNITLNPEKRDSFSLFSGAKDDDFADKERGVICARGLTPSSSGKNGCWIPVELENALEALHVMIGGETVSLPRLPGVRFAKLDFCYLSNVAIKNIRTYAHPEHVKAASLYEKAVSMKRSLPEKMQLIGEAADLGLAEAQNGYGLFGMVGMGGVSMTMEESFFWRMKAAKQGLPLAMFSVGQAYFSGKGVRKDDKDALQWYRKAARSGHPQAQLFTALILMRSDMVPHDMKEAQEWLGKVTAYISSHPYETDPFDDETKGNAFYLEAETFVMGENGAEKDYDMAKGCLKWAAEFGNVDAKRLLRNLD